MRAGRQFDIPHSHALQVPHHLGQGVFAKRNRLHANRKPAPIVAFVASRRSIWPTYGCGANGGRRGKESTSWELGLHGASAAMYRATAKKSSAIAHRQMRFMC